MPGQHQPPSYADCRRAAKAVRAAEHSRDAVNTVRPRGVFAVCRSRGPLSLVLYVAGRDGMLVWRGVDAFALLQSPLARPVKPVGGGARMAVLRLVDRRWDMLIYAVPPALAMLTALGLAGVAIPDPGNYTLLLVVGLLLVVAALGYIAVMMVIMLAGGILRGFYGALRRRRPTDDSIAVEVLPDVSWSMLLCHQPDGTRGRELLRHVSRHLGKLITGQLGQVAVELGAHTPRSEASGTLVCLRRGITTAAMSQVVAEWARRPGEHDDRAGVEVILKMSGHRAARRPARISDSGRFFFWYLVVVAAMVPMQAWFVADAEGEACAETGCDGRPASYLTALRWLAQRLLFTDPPGLTPGTFWGWFIGWTTSLTSLVGIGVMVIAGIQYRKSRQQVVENYLNMVDKTKSLTRVLILVATTTERNAVLAAVSARNGHQPTREFLTHNTVFMLGRISNAEIMLVQSEQGPIGPGASAMTTAALIDRLEPDFVVLTGICFGLRDGQELGDLIVCEQLRMIDHRKVTEPVAGAPPVVLFRGGSVPPSTILLDRFHAAEFDWSGPKVHFGPMLSSSVLVDSWQLRDELLRLAPEAYGGEMEGAGVFAAAAREKVDWIVVKAISDRGYDKTDDAQATAARNAAEFVVHTINIGALDEVPLRTAR